DAVVYAWGAGGDSLVTPQLAVDELDVVLDVLEVGPVSGGEVVEDAHAVAALEQRPDEVRADEPAAAGHEHAHQGSATTWKFAISEPVRGSRRSPERRSIAAAARLIPPTSARPTGGAFARRLRRSTYIAPT